MKLPQMALPQLDWRQKVLLAISLLLVSSYGFYRFNLLAPAREKTAFFTVAEGEGAPEIAIRLKQERLIRSRVAFLTYLTLHGLRSRLQVGTYEIPPGESGANLARRLAAGDVAANLLVVPEGSTIKQIKQLASKQGLDAAGLDAALQATYDYQFLRDQTGLEGYLFPDSYRVDNATAGSELVKLMLDNFVRRVTVQHSRGLAAQGLNLHQGITLASIVEREVAKPEDRAKVAQVLLKRLRGGQALEADATISYAADVLGQPFDLQLDSPYNTYRRQGLPPGPICNPGLGAIEAVINPAPTDYLYYLSDDEGNTHFARTFEEHQQNIQQYLR